MTRSIMLISCLFLFSTNANAASFDCNKASTLVEQAICSDSNLSVLDEKLAQNYKQAITSNPQASTIKSEQRSWLKNVRNRCSDIVCLTQAYTERIQQLDVMNGHDAQKPTNQNASQVVTIRGMISVGTLDSSVKDENGHGVIFLTDSNEAKNIFAVCGAGDLCEITGNVTAGEDAQLVGIRNVKLIKTEFPLTTNTGVSCDDVKHGNEKYFEKMDQLMKLAGLAEGCLEACFNRFQEDVVSELCSGQFDPARANVSSGDLTENEIAAISKVLGININLK